MTKSLTVDQEHSLLINAQRSMMRGTQLHKNNSRSSGRSHVGFIGVICAMALLPAASSSGALEDALRAALILQAGSDASIRRQVAALDNQFRVAQPGSDYHRRLTNAVVYLGEVNGHELNYKVYLANSVNAMAFPNGEIRIFSGLMDILTDEELTFVIGHEIGHVVKGHGMESAKRYKTRELTGLAAELLGLDERSSTAQALQGGVNALELHFSRTAELEADRFGLKLMKVLHLNEKAGVTALSKLADSGGSPGRVASWFTTHPDPLVRASKLERAIGP